jgi:hypothetical protein
MHVNRSVDEPVDRLWTGPAARHGEEALGVCAARLLWLVAGARKTRIGESAGIAPGD